MRTLDLIEAACLLKMNKEELRKKAKTGRVPGAKAGKRWVFIEDDLVAYLRSRYVPDRQALVGTGAIYVDLQTRKRVVDSFHHTARRAC